MMKSKAKGMNKKKTDIARTEVVKLTQVHANNANPRSISATQFHRLVNSVLVLPKMLELRPIVVDATMTALGGNMRYRALCAISDMSYEDIGKRLATLPDFLKKPRVEQEALLDYWLAWRDEPTAIVVNADRLSDAEKREFIIKDNVGFGEWDHDMLANEWDEIELKDWGMDVWQPSESTGVSPDDYPEDFTLPDGDKDNVETITFTLTSEQAEFVKEQLKVCQQEVGEFDDADTFGNSNKNGNAIYKIVKQWADARTL